MDKKRVQNSNPENDHNSQVVFHILFPILLTVVVCMAAFLFLIIDNSSQGPSTTQWANISIMFLIIPAAFFGLILMILLIVLSRLAGNWNQSLPLPLKVIRLKALILNQKIRNIADRPANVVIRTKSFLSGLRSIFKKISLSRRKNG